MIIPISAPLARAIRLSLPLRHSQRLSTKITMSLSELQHPRTKLLFHYDGNLHTNRTTLLATVPMANLPAADQSLLKPGSIEPFPTHALIAESTIFHPQGGGQPSDTGKIIILTNTSTNNESEENNPVFEVTMVRHALTQPSLVLHFGHFNTFPPQDTLTPSSTPILQTINQEKRLYYSRLHTAGHVLGAAVRHLLETEIPDFDELKASHFPASAACEFLGLIPSDQKLPIQAKVDSYIDAHMPVEIAFWSREDFREHGLERLIPKDEDWEVLQEVEGEGRVGRIRVVNIVGAEVYPCGGTHVGFTDECGKVTVRKVGRSKGTSRVSYAVD